MHLKFTKPPVNVTVFYKVSLHFLKMITAINLQLEKIMLGARDRRNTLQRSVVNT